MPKPSEAPKTSSPVPRSAAERQHAAASRRFRRAVRAEAAYLRNLFGKVDDDSGPGPAAPTTPLEKPPSEHRDST